jgi:transcriptional regulator with XRE-family HTH domain
MPDSALGRLLLKKRQKQGWTPSRASKAIGVSDVSYRMWEAGVWIPRRVQDYEKLEEWLEMDRVRFLELIGLIPKGVSRKSEPLRQAQAV